MRLLTVGGKLWQGVDNVAKVSRFEQYQCQQESLVLISTVSDDYHKAGHRASRSHHFGESWFPDLRLNSISK